MVTQCVQGRDWGSRPGGHLGPTRAGSLWSLNFILCVWGVPECRKMSVVPGLLGTRFVGSHRAGLTKQAQ